MSRKVLSVIIIAALSFILSACGFGGVGSIPGNQTASSGNVTLTEGAETVDVGDFVVYVPEGWLGMTLENYGAKQDKDGNYPIRTDAYTMVKGGKSEMDYFTKPTISIAYFADTDAGSEYDYSLTYEEEAIPKDDISVNGTKCPAFLGRSNYADEGEEPDFSEYIYVIIPVSDNSCFRVTIDVNDEPSYESVLSSEDGDVVEVMESLKVN